MIAMKRPLSLLAAASALALSANTLADGHVIHPKELTADDIAGKIFSHPDANMEETETGKVLDFTSLVSSDGKFSTGVYKTGPQYFDIKEPYGVDEFMYFLEGGVTLTSSDGTVTEITAGEALSMPKEWTGIWESKGYRKLWVIYGEED